MGANQTASVTTCRRPSRLLATIFRVAALSLLVLLLPGCLALLGLWFTAPFCSHPDANCGASGHLLYSTEDGHCLEEIAEHLGPGCFAWVREGEAVTGGFAFACRHEFDFLRLYVASNSGLLVYSGRRADRYRTATVPECADMQGVAALDDDRVVVACRDTGRLVKVDPNTASVVDEFSCCDLPNEDFDPVAITVAPDGAILAGTRRINRFDPASGAFLGVAVEEGVNGAER